MYSGIYAQQFEDVPSTAISIASSWCKEIKWTSMIVIQPKAEQCRATQDQAGQSRAICVEAINTKWQQLHFGSSKDEKTCYFQFVIQSYFTITFKVTLGLFIKDWLQFFRTDGNFQPSLARLVLSSESWQS